MLDICLYCAVVVGDRLLWVLMSHESCALHIVPGQEKCMIESILCVFVHFLRIHFLTGI